MFFHVHPIQASEIFIPWFTYLLYCCLPFKHPPDAVPSVFSHARPARPTGVRRRPRHRPPSPPSPAALPKGTFRRGSRPPITSPRERPRGLLRRPILNSSSSRNLGARSILFCQGCGTPGRNRTLFARIKIKTQWAKRVSRRPRR